MLVEARLTWEGDVVAVAHVRARRIVRLGDLALPGSENDRTVVFDDGRLTCDAITRDGTIVWLDLVEESERLGAARLGEFRTTKGVALAAVLHATLLAMAFIGRGSSHEEEEAHFETMKALSAVLEAREEVPLPTLPSDKPGAKPGESGLAGSPMAKPAMTRSTRTKGAENPDAKRRRELDEAREFGMIGLLAPPGGGDAFSTYEGPSALGSIFAGRPEDAFGFGGFGLSGTGLNGGGKGAGVGIDGVGLSGIGECGCGEGSGIHLTRVPSLRGAKTQVNGRLPPEIIQRIVRQNFGRMRMCYETGLKRNPGLEGRVSVKFVIDRTGAVAMASTSERSLDDGEVASCIERAFKSMSFPEPEGGIVTVVYPLVLST